MYFLIVLKWSDDTETRRMREETPYSYLCRRQQNTNKTSLLLEYLSTAPQIQDTVNKYLNNLRMALKEDIISPPYIYVFWICPSKKYGFESGKFSWYRGSGWRVISVPLPAHIRVWIEEQECHSRAHNASGTPLFQCMHREVINHLELQGSRTLAKPSKMFETW